MDRLEADPQDDTPPRRKLSRGARRQQLIEATIEMIGMRGYSRTTTGDVARHAGLSHGLVNFHFATKENLLSETLLYLAEEYRQNWIQAVEAAGPGPAEQLYAMLAADFRPEMCSQARLSGSRLMRWTGSSPSGLFNRPCRLDMGRPVMRQTSSAR